MTSTAVLSTHVQPVQEHERYFKIEHAVSGGGSGRYYVADSSTTTYYVQQSTTTTNDTLSEMEKQRWSRHQQSYHVIVYHTGMQIAAVPQLQPSDCVHNNSSSDMSRRYLWWRNQRHKPNAVCVILLYGVILSLYSECC